MKALLGLVALSTLTVACEFGEGDAKIPGEPLGTFHVVARLDQSTCGPGALGSPDVWEFDVLLSRDGPDLYWLNGEEPVFGTVAADGVTFSFGTETDVKLSEPGPASAGCTIRRVDAASGTLGGADTDVPHFEGLLRYGYTESTGSECAEYVGVEGGFAALPCEIGYRMTADRTKAPDEDE